MLDFLVGNDALSVIVAFALVLVPAVFIHELGHFLAAKAVGITILEFGIGFPPRMVKLFTRGETEYTLNWLPIGGFVRPLGEDFVRSVSSEEVERDRKALIDRMGESFIGGDGYFSERAALKARGITKTMSVNEAKPLARIFFMVAGALANTLTGFVVFMIIGLSGVPTGGMRVIYVEPESTWAAAGLQSGDVVEKVDNSYFDTLEQFFAQSHARNDQLVTLMVRRDDEVNEIALTPSLESATPTVQSYVYVDSIADDSPAAGAGIQPGDLIVAFDGEPFAAYADMPERTQDKLGQEATLTLLRDGETREVTIVPRTNPPQGQGAIGIGIRPAYELSDKGLIFREEGLERGLTLVQAAQYSLNRIGFFVESFIRLPGELLSGALTAEEARVVSPLGIGQIGAVFVQQSIEQDQPSIILNYIAAISILLGITQLLPLPMLDGGRIMFVLLEIVRGRPIAPEREGMVHLIGMAFLLSLMVIAFLNDIFNPVTNLIR